MLGVRNVTEGVRGSVWRGREADLLLAIGTFFSNGLSFRCRGGSEKKKILGLTHSEIPHIFSTFSFLKCKQQTTHPTTQKETTRAKERVGDFFSPLFLH